MGQPDQLLLSDGGVFAGAVAAVAPRGRDAVDHVSSVEARSFTAQSNESINLRNP